MKKQIIILGILLLPWFILPGSTFIDQRVEYFREIDNNSCDWNEGNSECLNVKGSTNISLNYINEAIFVNYSNPTTQSGSFIRDDTLDDTAYLYTTLEIRIKHSQSGGQFAFTGTNGGLIISNSGSWKTIGSTDFEIFTFELTSNWNAGNDAFLALYVRNSTQNGMDTDDNFTVDYIKLINPVDYNNIPDSYLPKFEERTDPYFWNTEDSIKIINLETGKYYGILIGSNQITSEQTWINFTAKTDKYNVIFRQNSEFYDENEEIIKELFFDIFLVENNSNSYINILFYDRLTLPIITKTDQQLFGFITPDIIDLGIIFLIGIFALSFTLYFFRRYF